jgi:quinol monooxygenase YgiN
MARYPGGGRSVYARLVRFTLAPGKYDRAHAIADELAPTIAAQPGCAGVTVFGDESDGGCGIFVLWDTQENADHAAQIIRPQLDKHLSDNVQSPPDARLFDVLSE